LAFSRAASSPSPSRSWSPVTCGRTRTARARPPLLPTSSPIATSVKSGGGWPLELAVFNSLQFRLEQLWLSRTTTLSSSPILSYPVQERAWPWVLPRPTGTAVTSGDCAAVYTVGFTTVLSAVPQWCMAIMHVWQPHL
jgi:hypothetical protein